MFISQYIKLSNVDPSQYLPYCISSYRGRQYYITCYIVQYWYRYKVKLPKQIYPVGIAQWAGHQFNLNFVSSILARGIGVRYLRRILYYAILDILYELYRGKTNSR